MKKKISLTPSQLDKNVERLNEFLEKKECQKFLEVKILSIKK